MNKDQQLALAELRKALCERLRNFALTDEMLADKCPYQLVCLVELVVGHRNYCPAFSHIVFALQETLGDAMWDKPVRQPATGSQTGDQKEEEVVH